MNVAEQICHKLQEIYLSQQMLVDEIKNGLEHQSIILQKLQDLEEQIALLKIELCKKTDA